MTESATTMNKDANATNKLVMSKALGAAFLNHQVEQLEKSVASPTPGVHSNNWRERDGGSNNKKVLYDPRGGRGRGSGPAPARGVQGRNDGGAKRRGAGGGKGREDGSFLASPRDRVERKGKEENAAETDYGPRKEREVRRERRDTREKEKDADVVVVDASVLIHCLGQVKKWSRDDREEVVIVPLEALNTLDLLKKGTSALAQRARAASRILEAQVGTNPRILVQRDEAFVLWDDINFTESASDQEKDKDGAKEKDKAQSSPEWVRRTICCAKWETDNAGKDDKGTVNGPKSKVVLAVLAPTSGVGSDTSTPTNAAESKPLPVPAPFPGPRDGPHPNGINKFEPRSSGTLVARWGRKAGMDVMEVKPSSGADSHGHGHGAVRHRESRDDERGGGSGGETFRKRDVRSPPATTANGVGVGSGRAGGGLVERPPAVMAMMEMVAAQQSQGGSGNGKVLRVLARGEKLEPDLP